MYVLKCPNCGGETRAEQVTPGALAKCDGCEKRFVVSDATVRREKRPPDPLAEAVDAEPVEPPPRAKRPPPTPQPVATKRQREAPSAETPRAESPKTESPKAASSKTESPKTEPPPTGAAAAWRRRRKRRKSPWPAVIAAVIVLGFLGGLGALIYTLARTPPEQRFARLDRLLGRSNPADAPGTGARGTAGSRLPVMHLIAVPPPTWKQAGDTGLALFELTNADAALTIDNPRIEWSGPDAVLSAKLICDRVNVYMLPALRAEIIDDADERVAVMEWGVPVVVPGDPIFMRVAVPAGYDTNWRDADGFATVDVRASIVPGLPVADAVPLGWSEQPLAVIAGHSEGLALRIAALNPTDAPLRNPTVVIDAADDRGWPIGSWTGTLNVIIEPREEFAFKVILPITDDQIFNRANVRGYGITHQPAEATEGAAR